MRVAVFGGTGFFGGYLVDALLARGHEPSLLVRHGSEAKLARAAVCRCVPGDVADAGAVAELLRDAEAVVYAIGILRERPRAGITFEALQFAGVERSIAAARCAGIRRYVLMSANGVRPDGSAYQQSKYRAEQALAASALDYTVFRPSVLFGDPRGRDEIASRLYRQVVRPPLPAAWFHTGAWPDANTVRLSPVHVADVAAAFALTLADPAWSGRTVALGGPEILSWRDMIARIAAAAGRQKVLLPVPIGLAGVVAALFDRWPAFPVTREQLHMLAEGNVADDAALRDILGRAARAFDAANLAYLRRGA